MLRLQHAFESAIHYAAVAQLLSFSFCLVVDSCFVADWTQGGAGGDNANGVQQFLAEGRPRFGQFRGRTEAFGSET